MIPFLPMIIGAVAGAALKPKNPLQGALLGATVGFTGGTALGLTAPTAAAGSGLTGSGVALGGTGTGTALGANTVGGVAGSTGLGTGSATALNAGTGGLSASGAVNAGTNLYGLGGTTAGLSAVPASAPLSSTVPGASYSLSTAPAMGNYSLIAPSPVTSPTTPSFMDKLDMAGKSAYAHPGESLAALNATQGLLSPEQIASAPAVPIAARGQLRPFDPVALMDPYKPSVIGNSQFSLI
jgi:hypothetical protein